MGPKVNQAIRMLGFMSTGGLFKISLIFRLYDLEDFVDSEMAYSDNALSLSFGLFPLSLTILPFFNVLNVGLFSVTSGSVQQRLLPIF